MDMLGSVVDLSLDHFIVDNSHLHIQLYKFGYVLIRLVGAPLLVSHKHNSVRSLPVA